MIIRDGKYDTTNRIVRYNGWPVYIKNRYNTVGYIPNMTSNTAPTPFIASASIPSAVRPPYYAFSTAGSPYSFANSPNNLSPSATWYLQINLGHAVSIWRMYYDVMWDANQYASGSFTFVITDDEDNVVGGLYGFLWHIEDHGSGFINFAQPSKKSTYFKMTWNANSLQAYSWNMRIYNFQIYAFD